MSDILQAAQTLILRLNAPPQYHSVWVRTEVDPDSGKSRNVLCVSIRPEQVNKIKVPDKHMGYDVIKEPWPEGV